MNTFVEFTYNSLGIIPSLSPINTNRRLIKNVKNHLCITIIIACFHISGSQPRGCLAISENICGSHKWWGWGWGVALESSG